jgi:uncharacterized protein (TIGR00369 family)
VANRTATGHPEIGPDGPDGAAQAAEGLDRIPEVLGELPGGDLADVMNIELTAATPERVTGRMPVKGNTQPYGLLHGGASCVLAETLGSVGAMLHAGPGRMAVGVDINATHHRSATEGYVWGVATRVHGGRTLATYDVVITDERDRRICTARITCMLRDEPQ